jgi:hypothetical protein
MTAIGPKECPNAIEDALLLVVRPCAIDAAIRARQDVLHQQDEIRAALLRDLEAARLMPLTGPFASMMLPIPRTVWWPPNWRAAETRR